MWPLLLFLLLHYQGVDTALAPSLQPAVAIQAHLPNCTSLHYRGVDTALAPSPQLVGVDIPVRSLSYMSLPCLGGDMPSAPKIRQERPDIQAHLPSYTSLHYRDAGTRSSPSLQWRLICRTTAAGDKAFTCRIVDFIFDPRVYPTPTNRTSTMTI